MTFTNEKNNLCMNKARHIPLLLTLLLMIGWTAAAQPFDRIERRNFWNSGKNINGLRCDSLTISDARIYGGYESGGLRDTYMASSTWNVGAIARTIVHLKKFSMNGMFSFENNSGKQMTGSMSGRPGRFPIEIIEFTPGNKNRQTYSFSGGITADISDNWRIGGKIDFTSENYTKRKDLRHTNYILDLSVAPGLLYHRGNFSAGLNYIFSKSAETISAEVLGVSSGSYYAFIDKGLMYGVYDIWDNEGIHLKESGVNGFPTRELSNGAAVQIQWKNLYAELEYTHSSGKSGEKQTVWFRFPSDKIAARAGFKVEKEDLGHYLRVEAAWKNLYNYESVLKQDTDNGVTITEVYGENRILKSKAFSVNTEYEIVANNWEFCTGAMFDVSQTLASPVYPFIYYRKIFTGEGYAGAMIKLGNFDLRGRISYRQGNWTDSHRRAEEVSGVSGKPFKLTEFDSSHLEYMTSPQISAALSLRFNFKNGIYIEASGKYGRGIDIEFLSGKDRWYTGLCTGYTF